MAKYCVGTFSGIDTGVFDNCILVGGKGGKPFDFESLDEGAIMKEIKAWVTKDVLHGIEVTLSDDSSRKFGRTEEMYPLNTETEEFVLRNFERITSLVIESEEKSLPEEIKGTLRGISLKTSQGRSWTVGPKSSKKVMKYDYPVGSGVCCGVFGYADDKMLYQIGFAMLQPVKEATLTKLRYLEEKNNYKKVPEIIETFTHINESAKEQKAKFRTSITIATTKTWGLTLTVARSFGLKLSQGVPEFVQIEASNTESESTSTQKENSTTNTTMKEFDWTVTAPPKTKIIATAKIYNCHLETEFEADMELRLMNGKVIKYKEKGTFSELTKREGWLETKEEAL